MHGESLLIDVAITLVAAFPLLLLGKRFGVPEVLSFIAAGIIIGPHALRFIGDPARIDEIAEIGVALILFFIGLHVPLARRRPRGTCRPMKKRISATPISAISSMRAGSPMNRSACGPMMIPAAMKLSTSGTPKRFPRRRSGNAATSVIATSMRRLSPCMRGGAYQVETPASAASDHQAPRLPNVGRGFSPPARTGWAG